MFDAFVPDRSWGCNPHMELRTSLTLVWTPPLSTNDPVWTPFEKSLQMKDTEQNEQTRESETFCSCSQISCIIVADRPTKHPQTHCPQVTLELHKRCANWPWTRQNEATKPNWRCAEFRSENPCPIGARNKIHALWPHLCAGRQGRLEKRKEPKGVINLWSPVTQVECGRNRECVIETNHVCRAGIVQPQTDQLYSCARWFYD